MKKHNPLQMLLSTCINKPFWVGLKRILFCTIRIVVHLNEQYLNNSFIFNTVVTWLIIVIIVLSAVVRIVLIILKCCGHDSFDSNK